MEDKGADVGNAESSAQETERCSGRSLVTLVTRLWDIATLSPFLSLLTDVTTPSQCALQHVFATSPSTRERKRKMFELFEFCCLRKLSAEVASVTAEQEGQTAFYRAKASCSSCRLLPAHPDSLDRTDVSDGHGDVKRVRGKPGMEGDTRLNSAPRQRTKLRDKETA